jgi:hypothetical protein
MRSLSVALRLDALGALACETRGTERASDLALIEPVLAAVGHAD